MPAGAYSMRCCTRHWHRRAGKQHESDSDGSWGFHDIVLEFSSASCQAQNLDILIIERQRDLQALAYLAFDERPQGFILPELVVDIDCL